MKAKDDMIALGIIKWTQLIAGLDRPDSVDLKVTLERTLVSLAKNI